MLQKRDDAVNRVLSSVSWYDSNRHGPAKRKSKPNPRFKGKSKMAVSNNRLQRSALSAALMSAMLLTANAAV
ncbi:MAG TPA: hypothetical protein VGQ93_16320, partial [Lysobacter sp.]|nr:hypothetical protein [Lysobacter sp.]